MGGVTGVFEMPNTNPLTTTRETFEDKIAPRHRPHALRLRLLYRRHARQRRRNCRSSSGCPAAPASRCSWARPPARCWCRTMTASKRSSRAISRRAAFHSEDEYRLEERKHLRVPGDPTSHPVWRDPEAALRSTKRLVALARKTGKRIHVLHISTAEEMVFLADAQGRRERRGDAAPPDARRDRLHAARHLRADEPAGARQGASRGHLGRRRQRRRRHPRLRPRAAYARGKGPRLPGVAIPA